MTTFHVQYVTNEHGLKTAVQIPLQEWQALLKEYAYFKQYATLKQGLTEAFQEIREIENGKTSGKTLQEFLNEC